MAQIILDSQTGIISNTRRKLNSMYTELYAGISLAGIIERLTGSYIRVGAENDIWLNVTGFKAPGVKPATLVDYGIGDAWEFTDGTDDTVVARVKFPDNMDRNQLIKFFVGWNTTTASAGNCIWDIEYLFRSLDDVMDAAADGTLTATIPASAVAKGLSLSLIGEAIPSPTDFCVTIRVKRRADLIGDTLGEDNHLFGVCLIYTANTL